MLKLLSRQFAFLAVFFVAALAAGCDGSSFDNETISKQPKVSEITSFPISLDAQCRGGEQELYDECSDQLRLFEDALVEARRQNKTLLVSFGAEWCIWCHVFEKYIKGQAGKFTYTFGEPGSPRSDTETLFERRDEATAIKQAEELNNYFAANFVLVHIDAEYAPQGWDVLEQMNASSYFDNWLPFIFATDDKGMFVAQLPHGPIEERRDGIFDWYRGYDRPLMLEKLRNMRMQASSNTE
ncbi:MAG: thioredoxin family protein [Pseudomonadota bacterium]